MKVHEFSIGLDKNRFITVNLVSKVTRFQYYDNLNNTQMTSYDIEDIRNLNWINDKELYYVYGIIKQIHIPYDWSKKSPKLANTLKSHDKRMREIKRLRKEFDV